MRTAIVKSNPAWTGSDGDGKEIGRFIFEDGDPDDDNLKVIKAEGNEYFEQMVESGSVTNMIEFLRRVVGGMGAVVWHWEK